MKADSVCWSCKHCLSELAFQGGPSIEECEEDSEQFMMPEGCWYYDERKDDD